MGEIVITHEKLDNPQSRSTECLSYYNFVQTLIIFWLNAMSASKEFE